MKTIAKKADWESAEAAALSRIEEKLAGIQASFAEVVKLFGEIRSNTATPAGLQRTNSLVRPQAIRSVRLPRFFYDDEVRDYIVHALQTRLVSLSMLRDEVRHLFGEDRTPSRSAIGAYAKRSDAYWEIYKNGLAQDAARPKAPPARARKRRS